MMNKEKILLAIGGLLIAYAVFQPSLNVWSPTIVPTPTPVVNIEVEAPSDADIK